MQLYIIGNGFDRAHGMPTSYMDFYKYIQKKDRELASYMDEYYVECCGNNLWTYFEDLLGNLSVNNIFDYEYKIVHLEGYEEPDKEYNMQTDRVEWKCQTIKERLPDIFTGWINNIPIATTMQMNLSSQALYYTFNYTRTLEDLYHIPVDNIWHIHGSISDPIFGHGNVRQPRYNAPEKIKWINTDKTEDAVRMLFNSLHKNVADIIRKNPTRFSILSDVSEIYIKGHSLNKIDRPYLEEIFKNVSPSCIWNVTYHEPKEDRKFRQILQNIGVANNHIHVTKIFKEA